MEQQSLTSERWRQVKGIFQTAIELPVDKRAVYLMDACPDAPSLRTEVESLIAAHEELGSFLDTPAVDLAAEALVADLSSSLVGKFLGRYQILTLLSRGGMGEVYRAKDTMLGREVAIKVLPADFASDQERLQRFEQEARAASALNHPNIITIHEIGRADGVHFIVSEFIEGETLRRRAADERISPDAVVEIAIQITGALNAAHEAGIVHRDIKPQNIMVRPDGLVKVLDFGLAKLTDRPFSTTFDTNAPTLRFKTEPGIIMGTMAYMSPEQVRGQELDKRTDIFSLGVVLYEMAAGHSLFARETAADVIASILEKDPPPLAQFAAEVPETLERIIRKALSKDREERYQTARDLLADLRNFKSTDGSVASISAKSESLLGAIRRHRRFAALTLVALMAVIASVIHYGNSGKAIETIAVLPFVNADGDPETEYLADGMTEILINDLSHLSNLKVRPRNSVFRYKKREIDPQAAGRELDVEAVLTGQVVLRGEELTISLQLIDVRDNRQIWGARRQRRPADLLTLQADLSREISENLRLRLSPADQRPGAKRQTDNIDAYRAYIRGRYFWNKRSKEGFERAIEFYDQAIAIDPKYALAYSGLADCHLSRVTYGVSHPAGGFAKAKQAAKRALAINDTLAEAHTSLAHIMWLHEWDWAGAEKEFKRAIELDPGYSTAHQWYAIYLSSMARHEEAIVEIRRAQALDPLSTIVDLDAARTFYFARQYDLAIEQCIKALEMDPGFQRLNTWLKLAYEQRRFYDKAFEADLKTLTERGARPEKIAALKKAYAASGWRGYWRKQLEFMEEEAKKPPISPYHMAQIYARLGDHDQALMWLEKAYDKHSSYLVLLKVDPLLDGLRSDARFNSLLLKVGLTP